MGPVARLCSPAGDHNPVMGVGVVLTFTQEAQIRPGGPTVLQNPPLASMNCLWGASRYPSTGRRAHR